MGNSNSSPRELSDKPVVAILGAGYAGIAAAKILDRTGDFNVVLIDRKNYFLHNVATLRATVDRKFYKNIFIPYNKFLKNGSFVQAEVTQISKAGLKIVGLSELFRYDYLIVCTGTSYAFPGKIAAPEMADAIKLYEEIQDIVEKAQKIVVVGGGSVGCELAGEISSTYKNKNVTLIHPHKKLAGDIFEDSFTSKLESSLRKMSVDVVLEERIQLGQFAEQAKSFQGLTYIKDNVNLKTNSGREFNADLVFFCIGTKINNKSFHPHFTNDMDERGRLKVNSSFLVGDCFNVFSIGDCCNMEEKMAYYAEKHAAVVAENIIRTKNLKALKTYSPSSYPAMLLTLGKSGGVSQLPTPARPVLGNQFTRIAKARTLFTEVYWSKLNQDANHVVIPDSPHDDDGREKNISAAFGVSEEEAKQMLSGTLGGAIIVDKTQENT
eukprot:TRINITY_DN7786_c0_g1_i1.p1 TRINITY_DN7786_c0_g1~~TRINITY_DN7786_c0_g1_i1.p1  ORF type:complete len:437 (+),score=149.76 TRINITY_DN7786_c0_g1_i1:15-1325(+)